MSAAAVRPHPHDGLERPVPPEARGKLVRVYVWQVPVRVTHWTIALSLFVLAFTGYFVSNPPLTAPGPAREHFMMGTLRLIHFYAAIIFSVAVLARGLWSLVGNRYSSWRIFLPVEAKRFKALPDNRWELQLTRPIADLPRGMLVVAVKDKQGNVSRIERTLSVSVKKTLPSLSTVGPSVKATVATTSTGGRSTAVFWTGGGGGALPQPASKSDARIVIQTARCMMSSTTVLV